MGTARAVRPMASLTVGSDAPWIVPVIAAGLFVAAAALFSRTLGSGFVNWDDPRHIVENPSFRGLGWEQLKWMFTTFHMGHYQPLSWVSLGFDYLWGRALLGDGLKPLPYHLTNSVLHAGSAALVYLLALRLLRAALPPAAGHGSWPLHAAGIVAALLFAAHPLRVESVAWATERRDVLSSFFLLLTLVLYLQACCASGHRGRWLAIAVAAYAASLLSRAMGVTLPVILLLLDWYPLRRLGWRGAGPAWGVVLLEKVPFLVLAVAAGIVAPLAQEAAGAAMSLERHTAVGRVAQACYGLVFYLWKTAVPVQLSPIYELRLPIDVCLPRYIASMALVAAGLVSIAVLALRRRLWWPLVAVGIYAILLLPVSGLAQSGIQEVADRYSYLPGIVIAMFTAAGLLRIWQYPARSAALRWGLGAAAGLAIVVLAGLTWRQCGVWHDTTTLWTHAIAVSPETSAAQNGYGWVLREQKRYDEALQHLRRAVEIQPNNEKAHRNIWATLKDQGRSDELLQAYRDAIRVHPYFADAYFNLGAALQARGDYDGAIEAYEAAVALQPDNYRAHSNLGYILAGCGELNAAREHCEAAIAAHPTEVFARCVLARILKEQGLDSEAVRQLRAALQIDPNDAGSRQLLEQWTAAPRP